MDAHTECPGIVDWNPGDVPPWFDVPPEGEPEPPKPDVPRTWHGAPLVHAWAYKAADGATLGIVGRYDGPAGKQVVPFFKMNGSGWKAGAAPEPRPLFGLDVLASNPDGKAVVIVEGEKCAAALQSLGIVALTSPGGSRAASKADWQPLSGARKVYVLPDADAPGAQYAADVCACLRALEAPPALYLVTLPGLPPGGDIVDWLQARCPGWNGFEPLPEAERLFSEFRAAIREYAKPAPEASVSGADWPEPMSLDVAELPPWPRGVLPEPLESFVWGVAEATETPPELAAMLALAAVGVAAQGRFEVEVKHGYREPLQIWTATALPPGNRKTAVVSACAAPLFAYERARAAELAPAIRKAKSDLKTAQARVESVRARAAKQRDDFEYDVLRHEVERLEAALPEVPVAPRLLSDDVTPEKLGAMMAEHKERMGVLSDEAGIFELMGGRYSNGTPNLDVYLKGHAGSPVIVDRGSRPSVHMLHPCLTLGLSPQPEVLAGLSSKPGFRGRGLLGRFLYALPKSPLGTRAGNARPVPDALMSRYAGMLEALLSIPEASLPDGTPCPYVLPLSHDAYAVWRAFDRRIEPELGEGGRFEHITDWAGKLCGAVARIAGLLHCARYATDGPQGHGIGQVDMEAAALIGDALSAHALSAFGMMGAKPELDDARKVLSWVRQTRQASFTFRDCHRAHQSRFPLAEDMAPAIRILEERGLIREMPQDEPRHGPGRKPSKTYAVHPKVGI